MSVLETFFFMFDSDASAVKKGTDEAKKSTDALTDAVKKSDQATAGLGGNFVTLARSAAGFLGAILSVGAIASAARASADFSDELNDQAEALDINIEALHAYTNAAWSTGGSAEGFRNSITTLNESLQNVAATGSGRVKPVLESMGFSLDQIKKAAKDPIAFMGDLADKFEDLSKVEAAGLGAKLGLDQGTINLLTQGRRGMDEIIARQKEFGVVTKEDAEAAAEFNDSLDDLSKVTDSVRRGIATNLLPGVTWLINGFRSVLEWTSRNSFTIKTFFTGIGVVLTAVYLPAVIRAAAATWALIAPYAAIGAAIIAIGAIFALVADDVRAFLAGQNSVIGELSKKWPIVGEIVRGLADYLNELWNVAKAVFQFFVDAVTQGPEQALKNLGAALDAIVKSFVEKFPGISKVVGTVGEFMSGMANDVKATWQALVDFIKGAIDLAVGGYERVKSAYTAVKNFVGLGDDAPAAPEPSGPVTGTSVPMLPPGWQPGQPSMTPVEQGQRLMRDANTSPLTSQSSSAISNTQSSVSRSTTVQVGDVNVTTAATDPNAVGAAVGQSLSDQIKSAIDQNDDGVAG